MVYFFGFFGCMDFQLWIFKLRAMMETSPVFARRAGSFQMKVSPISLLIFRWFLVYHHLYSKRILKVLRWNFLSSRSGIFNFSKWGEWSVPRLPKNNQSFPTSFILRNHLTTKFKWWSTIKLITLRSSSWFSKFKLNFAPTTISSITWE